MTKHIAFTGSMPALVTPFKAGKVDEVALDLAPVLLGAGKRYFGEAVLPEGLLDDPTVVQGDRVLHLRYRVRR